MTTKLAAGQVDTYRVVVGEIGNELGHVGAARVTTLRGAKQMLGIALHPYHGDGWGRIEVRVPNGQWYPLSV